LQNGTEITGVGIPSLRRLFEIAVGKETSLFPTPEPKPSSDQDTITIGQKGDIIAGGPRVEGTHLSRTLGVHQETPALVAILGGRAARRQIRVFDEDEPVDIENVDRFPKPHRRWKARYSHRNHARPELEVSLDWSKPAPIGNTGGRNDDRCEVISNTGAFESTRFHITCRVVISDRSRWLSPGKFSRAPFNRLSFFDL
jgi:hypothetical protein